MLIGDTISVAPYGGPQHNDPVTDRAEDGDGPKNQDGEQRRKPAEATISPNSSMSRAPCGYGSVIL
jgi:hypothetical protein